MMFGRVERTVIFKRQGLRMALFLLLMLINVTNEVLGEDAKESEPVCSLDVINPTCNNGTKTPQDLILPCIPWSSCEVIYSGEADCLNWVCSLRANCGCFAGQVTSCAANATWCTKSGCSEVVKMFTQSKCKFEDYFGPRDDPKAFNMYLEDCLAGCSNGSAIHEVSAMVLSVFVALVTLVFVG